MSACVPDRLTGCGWRVAKTLLSLFNLRGRGGFVPTRSAKKQAKQVCERVVGGRV